jgi:hypothetical protein
MLTVFLYFFVASTWGLGLLSWVVVLSHKLRVWELEVQDKALEAEQKKQLFNRLNQMSGKGAFAASPTSVPKEIPEKIKELMKSSPNHPEVDEIDGSDQILGVRFEAENYPPGFGGDMDEE